MSMDTARCREHDIEDCRICKPGPFIPRPDHPYEEKQTWCS